MSLCNKNVVNLKSIPAADRINDKLSFIVISCRKFKNKNQYFEKIYPKQTIRDARIVTKCRKRNTTTISKANNLSLLLAPTLQETDGNAVISWTRWHSSRELQQQQQPKKQFNRFPVIFVDSIKKFPNSSI